MSHSVLVLNGPNLNQLGQREPEIYGHATLADVDALCIAQGSELGLTVECRQSNAEHQLIDWVQQAGGRFSAIVINAGAYTHTSIALRDALMAYAGPVIEVHISNVLAREVFRHHSYISPRANGVIVGCGVTGYRFALSRVAELLQSS